MRYRPFLAAVLAVAALATAGCRAAPLLDTAVGWSSTADMTGPHVKVGLGEYQVIDPVSGGTPCEGGVCRVTPDPALQEALKGLDAKAKEADAKVAAIERAAAEAKEAAAAVDAKVAAGTLTPEQGQAIKDAAAKAEKAALDATAAEGRAKAAEATAREAVAKAQALDAKASDLEGKVGKPPSVPTDWTPTGLAAAALAAAGWWARKRAAAEARRLADEAKAHAQAAVKAGIEAFDALPESADTGQVRTAVERALPPAT